MEYFAGAFITLSVVFVMNKLISKQLVKEKKTVVRYSQSHVYKMSEAIMFGPKNSPVPDSQSKRYQNNVYLKIVVAEGRAYWIKDNAFYVADIVDGSVDKETTKQVDTMSMDNVELKKMLVIVETLREGDANDGRNSGKP